MKKNVMLKIASVLMIAVLLTTCAISSTFAKYVTSDKDTVTAHVAKWGVELDTNVQGLFAKTYAKDSTTEIANTVDAAELAVAPGTTKSINVAASVSGKPEVAFKVTTEAEIILTGWEVDGSEYCPLTFTVGTTTYSIEDTTADVTCTDIEDLVGKVTAAIAQAGTAEYAANTELTEDGDATKACDFDIAWSWAYEGIGSDDEKNEKDIKDTKLGDIAAKATAPTVKFTLTQSITQID